MQIEPPVTIVLPVPNRYITTFKKLPMIQPNKKIKTNIRVDMSIL